MTAQSIGALAKATGVKVTTIRFYEQIGLLPEPVRLANDRRVYGEAAERRLAFIKHARQLGFGVDAIRVMLDLSDHPDRPCDEANRLAAAQLVAVESRIARLEALRDELARVVAHTCSGQAADCRVIEALSDHSFCDGDHEAPEALGTL